MPGSAASGISRAEAYQKTTQNDRGKSLEREQCGPREHLARRKPGEVVNAQSRQGESGLFRNRDVLRSSPMRSQEAAHQNAGHEKKVPKAGSFPVVTKIIKLAGKDDGTQIPQAAGNAEHLVAQDQERGHEQPDRRTGYVPGPRGRCESHQTARYSPAVRDTRDPRLEAVWVTTGRPFRWPLARCVATMRFGAAVCRYATGISSRSPAAGDACFSPLAAAMLPPAMP